jgi:hypothetical protein
MYDVEVCTERTASFQFSRKTPKAFAEHLVVRCAWVYQVTGMHYNRADPGRYALLSESLKFVVGTLS